MAGSKQSRDGALSRRNVLRSVGAATAAGAVVSGQATAATDEARARRAQFDSTEEIERQLSREAPALTEQLRQAGVEVSWVFDQELVDVESFDPSAVGKTDDFARLTNWKRNGDLSARVEVRRVTDERTVTLIMEPRFGVYGALLDDGDSRTLIDADGTVYDKEVSKDDIACIDDLFEGCTSQTVYCDPSPCYAYPNSFDCSYCPYFDCEDYCSGY